MEHGNGLRQDTRPGGSVSGRGCCSHEECVRIDGWGMVSAAHLQGRIWPWPKIGDGEHGREAGVDVAIRTVGCPAWETRFSNGQQGVGSRKHGSRPQVFPEKVKPSGRFNPPPGRFLYEAPRVWESGSERGLTYSTSPFGHGRTGSCPLTNNPCLVGPCWAEPVVRYQLGK